MPSWLNSLRSSSRIRVTVLQLLQGRASRFWQCPAGRLPAFAACLRFVEPFSKCESEIMNNAVLALIGMPGIQELMIILFICLLLFGSSRLPSLMRSLGSSAREFKKGVQGADEELEDATRAIEKDDKED